MYCKHCGKKIDEASKFCIHCGLNQQMQKDEASKVVKNQHQISEPNMAKRPEQKKVGQKQEKSPFSPNILKGVDGVYRWTYGMSMWKNPTILITVWKVFMIGAMFPVLLVTVLTLVEEGLVDGFVIFFKMLLLMGGIMTGLVMIAYPIVAVMNGGSYQVVFELNSEGINHIQMQKQFKKNQVLAFITVLAGAASGSPQVAGAGLLAGSKESSYSDFKHVKKIVVSAKRHVIYINESLQHNQVYVAKEDFDQVKAYIVDHCKEAKVIDK